ncbi:hypothetical protein CWATWH8502_2106 [Crocosphaera watsonii WH 8502]|uniref:Uncharacterized protein n=2 Tax=Crocosphaera watsonii TaxID=263511 RepID=T2JXM7_CROWT|nr:hypothetical protein CWATWH8502_2106 [Crocosphaera watsonii WH 8502]CCQ70558.1 hypothetical protein CWATWH0402_5679 [Crocosphaera watsonii WH 0402]
MEPLGENLTLEGGSNTMATPFGEILRGLVFGVCEVWLNLI